MIITLACLPNYRSPINCLFERVRSSTETFSQLEASPYSQNVEWGGWGGDYIDRTGKYININFTMKITH